MASCDEEIWTSNSTLCYAYRVDRINVTIFKVILITKISFYFNNTYTETQPFGNLNISFNSSGFIYLFILNVKKTYFRRLLEISLKLIVSISFDYV